MARRLDDGAGHSPYQKKTDLKYNQFNTLDKEYEAERNKLITCAAKRADEVMGIKPEIQPKESYGAWKMRMWEWSERWNRLFFQFMDIEARAAGIVK